MFARICYFVITNYYAFLSIERYAWIVLNTCNYSETKSQRLGIL